MKTDVKTLDAGSAGSVELSDAIFGLEPRVDILPYFAESPLPVPRPSAK